MKWLNSAPPKPEDAMTKLDEVSISKTNDSEKESKSSQFSKENIVPLDSDEEKSKKSESIESPESKKPESLNKRIGDLMPKAFHKALPKVVRRLPSAPVFNPNNHWFHLASLAVMNFMVYFAYTGAASQLIHMSGINHINAVNLQYLEHARQYTLELLSVLSESKLIMSLLQSSQGGVDFIVDVQVQVGQVLTPLTDAINYAWQLSIAALASVEFLSLSMELSHIAMGPVLTLMFMLFGIAIAVKYALPKISSSVFKLGLAIAFLSILTHFIVPLSIYGTAMVSKYALSDHKEAVSQGFKSVHSKLPSHNRTDGLKDQVKHSISTFSGQQHHLHRHTSTVTGLTARTLVVSFIEYLIIPLLFLFGLIVLAQKALAQYTLKN